MNKPNRPPDTDFSQQRLKTTPASFGSVYLAVIVLIIGIVFLPTGTKLTSSANNIYENKITYDDGDSESLCSISNSNEGKQCTITFNIDTDVDGPVYVYYEMSNFFQNHRRYYQSRDLHQLQGEKLTKNDVSLTCNALYKNGTLLLNPCGLIANSFFNDVIALDSSASTPTNLVMDETGISVYSDRKELFKQVTGFQYVQLNSSSSSSTCASEGLPDGCKSYIDSATGVSYLYYYPDDDTVQYLHESYPNQISPIVGVEDEHFIVWMRTAALPTFRKLYGKIDSDFKSGDVIVFNITANYEVNSFDATKSLLISNLGNYGGKNTFLGQVYITIGSFSLIFGAFLICKEYYPEISALFL